MKNGQACPTASSSLVSTCKDSRGKITRLHIRKMRLCEVARVGGKNLRAVHKLCVWARVQHKDREYNRRAKSFFRGNFCFHIIHTAGTCTIESIASTRLFSREACSQDVHIEHQIFMPVKMCAQENHAEYNRDTRGVHTREIRGEFHQQVTKARDELSMS